MVLIPERIFSRGNIEKIQNILSDHSQFKNLLKILFVSFAENSKLLLKGFVLLLSIISFSTTFSIQTISDDITKKQVENDTGATLLNNFISKNDAVLILQGLLKDSVDLDRQAYIYALLLREDERSENELTQEANTLIHNSFDYGKIINAPKEVEIAKAKLSRLSIAIEVLEKEKTQSLSLLLILSTLLPIISFLAI